MGKRQQWEKDEGGVSKRRKVAVAAADTIDDLDNLECLICRHPLRPPIFQCTMSHTICSSCHDKFPDKCCYCSLPTVYNRCHQLEDVVESIKLACSNAEHGCTARITYYQKEEHEKDCPHAPCFCPATDCSFKGPTAMLLEHFSGEHKSPSTKFIYNEAFGLRIHGDAPGSVILVGEDGQLFLLDMKMESAGGVISVCCVQPHITGSKFMCRLSISCNEMGYSQAAEFQTRSTNLYDGMPKDFMFLVPKVLLRRAITIVRVTLTPQQDPCAALEEARA